MLSEWDGRSMSPNALHFSSRRPLVLRSPDAFRNRRLLHDFDQQPVWAADKETGKSVLSTPGGCSLAHRFVSAAPSAG